MFFIYYLVICLLVGLLGMNRKSGFLLTFLLSIFLTPVITAILLLLTKERAT